MWKTDGERVRGWKRAKGKLDYTNLSAEVMFWEGQKKVLNNDDAGRFRLAK
tara:strand:+ start:596 stop:748 length:153 start_codon:yes stop_codon:yes gene_type:complete